MTKFSVVSESLALFPPREVDHVPELTNLETRFPAVDVSRLAEQESWRKEVHRPATHTHKWWAQRLGTVFRGILVAAVSDDSDNDLASDGLQLGALTVFDPFAGSGTTLVEAAKLGARVVGWDINPVATLVQRQALQAWNRQELDRAFRVVEHQCREEIDRLHRTETGETVLYYFWVARVECLTCSVRVRLFSDHIFAHHAYPRRYPRSQAVCPTCLDIQATHFAVEQLRCRNGHSFTKKGAVSGAHLTCSNGHQHSLIASLAGQAPEHDLYAKLVLGRDGSKSYESVDQFDLDLYQEANELLDKKRDLLVLPRGELKDGYNTRQALRWGYRNWLDFFNARQLYCLGLLGAAIRELAATPNEREALAALFSGTLEFNNLFCSFKGEGTGAVRHMFSHHVLKPERTPLEAHPWGTPASSGSFSTLFRSRLIRAHEYKQSPHDQVLVGDTVRRQRGSSTSIALDLVTRWPTSGLKVGQAYVRSGDSSHTDLPTASIDLIITDPPFMDNVHYSELADFFHAWLRALDPFDGYPSTVTSTRSQGEVQATDPTDFCNAITGVWRECFRVLKPTGLLAFTFHHSRTAGWVAVMRALNEANFVVTELQPVKAEMSSSVTKGGAAEPSNLDSIIVCRPRATARPYVSTTDEARVRSASLLAALLRGGVTVGIGDARSVVRGSVLSLLTNSPDEVDEDKLSVLADEIADEVISCLGLSPSRNLLMEDRLR